MLLEEDIKIEKRAEESISWKNSFMGIGYERLIVAL